MTRDELAALAQEEQRAQLAMGQRILVCTGSGCLAAGAKAVRDSLERAAGGSGAETSPRVQGTGCPGLCARGPIVTSVPDGMMYPDVRPEHAPAIVARVRGEAETNDTPRPVEFPPNLPFFARQLKVVLANAGYIDPERIQDYVGHGGYAALARALDEMTPRQIVDEISRSGLRGRGGAGYPTGLKWGLVAKAPSEQKYVICNGDEGDPGAFMDRSVMEADPHRVLEGMAIAAYAVGASQGYVYVRGEYPLAVSRLQTAIRQAERLGLLGTRILDTPFSFRVDVRIGAGAFVCGEETALIASIEGRRGLPSPRPPYPAQSGLWAKPTLINNVETFANVAPIIQRGGDWYVGIGTDKSHGTKVFALAGKIVNTGLIEIPFGMTLREVIFEVGGGIPGNRPFKAVQTGGPSGGCIPASLLDTPLDYESLANAGSIIGSGGMIVMDDSACMVDVARYYMEFCMHESCGKCVPCRAGTVQMLRLIERITRGQGTEADLDQLAGLSEYLRDASLCGLGQTAPNPVVSGMRYFQDEFRAHVVDRVCPAGVCSMSPEAELATLEHQEVST
ncbi:MAG TPA: NuoF family protein [Chloroflexota bacterium]|nr:NuoF family protein [Chloroflexota bacterium]